MNLRLIQPSDLAACCALIPADRRPDRDALPFLAACLARGKVQGAVTDAAPGELMACGISGFASDAFIDAHLREPVPGIARRLLTRAVVDESVLLGPREIGQANVDRGLNLVVLWYQQTRMAPDDPLTATLMYLGHDAFRRLHEGFRVRSVWQEGNEFEAAFLTSGGFLPKQRFADGTTLFGFSRSDLSSPWPSHTLSFLFRDPPCRLHFSAAERRILSLALWNLRDHEIARRLGISVDTVRKQWRHIFQRAEAQEPQSLGAARAERADDATRGTERRRFLLEHLRRNLHEVRPVPGASRTTRASAD
jgi:hypothetical protein